jgi:hypothetical protein
LNGLFASAVLVVLHIPIGGRRARPLFSATAGAASHKHESTAASNTRQRSIVLMLMMVREEQEEEERREGDPKQGETRNRD